MGYRIRQDAETLRVEFTASRSLRIVSWIMVVAGVALVPLWLVSFGLSPEAGCLSLPLLIGLLGAMRILPDREELLVSRESVGHSRSWFGHRYLARSVPVQDNRFHCADQPRFLTLLATPSHRLWFADLQIGERALTDDAAQDLSERLNRFLAQEWPQGSRV